MTLILPLPPTDNNLRIPSHRGSFLSMVKTKTYRDWEKAANIELMLFKAMLLREHNCRLELDTPCYEAQYRYHIKLCLNNKRKDISNFSKALKDWMTGRIYTEDKWVDLHIEMPVIVGKGTETVEINLEPVVYRVES